MEGLTQEQYNNLVSAVGTQAASKISQEMANYTSQQKQMLEGFASKEQFEAAQKSINASIEAVKEIVKNQGLGMNDILARVNTSEFGHKSIAETLKTDEEELRSIYRNGIGVKTYMVQATSKGFVMKPFDVTSKAAGPQATVANVGGAGNTVSVTQSIDATTLLRLGGDAPIISQYRNSRWVFDLVNIQNAGFENPWAMWYEEQAKQGASATVAEGAAKPMSQYAYQLKSASYKKEATLIGFTDEFALDFARLQGDILDKGRTDVINRINSQILTNVIAAATAYNTATQYKNGAALTQYNDYLAIDALSAQVDNATFGQGANAAIMSTFKSHRVNTQMDTQGRFLMPPASLSGLSMVGNPAMGVDDLLVGDFKQYNVILRGGLIVKVGYNGNDFANNMFSTVIEQYYFDYISAIRAAAIVKGSTFAAVKTAITT